MRKKVLISGVLGYIGSELVKLLKDDYEVVGFDSAFFPERVSWLKANGVKFYQRDIFNCKDLLQDAEYFIHLAGITTVAQTIQQSTPQGDAEIFKIGTEGTRYLIENTNKDTKFLFASTHCVFEATNEPIITERSIPCPILAYARSKFQSELDLQNSGLNYVISRLASVFGMGSSTMRWKIVANLFSKFAAVDKKIKIFGAKSIKPLVGLNDVARSFKFLIENDFNRDIFHIVSQHYTVAELAEFCKYYVPDLELEYTNEQVVGLGYKFGNEKIRRAGFIFNQSVAEEMGKMIESWRTV